MQEKLASVEMIPTEGGVFVCPVQAFWVPDITLLGLKRDSRVFQVRWFVFPLLLSQV